MKRGIFAVTELTALDGKDCEVMDRVGLSVQRLGRGDDSTQSLHVKESLQVSISVDGVPTQKYRNMHTTDTNILLKNAFK